MKLSYDLHIHSCLSPCGDNEATPASIAGMATLIGLDAVALTDHNTCKNCGAFLTAAAHYGVAALPGMELTTMEEIHVLFYFRDLSDAMAFDAYVEPRILPIPNRPKYFGDQLIMNELDEPCGTFPTLLISATDISFDEALRLAPRFRAVAVPAHIDKSSTSVLSQLGAIPPDSTFRLAEVTAPEKVPNLQEAHPHLKKCSFLFDSDAHALDRLQEPVRFLEAEARTGEAVFDALYKLQYG